MKDVGLKLIADENTRVFVPCEANVIQSRNARTAIKSIETEKI